MNAFVTALKRYAKFSGRAGRPEYWYFSLIYLLASVILAVLDMIAGWYDPKVGMGVLSAIFTIGLLLPSLAVSVRRLHDTGRNGWWMLIAFVPLVGVIVLLVFMAQRSEAAPNAWGDGPDVVD